VLVPVTQHTGTTKHTAVLVPVTQNMGTTKHKCADKARTAEALQTQTGVIRNWSYRFFDLSNTVKYVQITEQGIISRYNMP